MPGTKTTSYHAPTYLLSLVSTLLGVRLRILTFDLGITVNDVKQIIMQEEERDLDQAQAATSAAREKTALGFSWGDATDVVFCVPSRVDREGSYCNSIPDSIGRGEELNFAMKDSQSTARVRSITHTTMRM